jgi:hypothetical protein
MGSVETLNRKRVIFVTGACPGAGKTSLSALVVRRLQAANVPAQLLSEDRLLQLEPFARFDDELFREDRGAIRTLLLGVRATFADAEGRRGLWITDALLPGWFWLLGRYSFEEIAAVSDQLADSVRPFRPLIVYLTGNVEELFGRAVAERGEDWRRQFLAAITRWHIPLYPGGPVRNQDDLLKFLTWLNGGSLQLLDRWAGDSLLLEASTEPVHVLATAVLERMGA